MDMEYPSRIFGRQIFGSGGRGSGSNGKKKLRLSYYNFPQQNHFNQL